MKNFRNYKSKKGFTLMETLVALSIIMIGLSAAFTVAQMGIQSSSFAKDRITAFFLAQEAFEAVKARRDHNLLQISSGASISWLDGIVPQCGTIDGSPCDYDLKNSLSGGGERFLNCNTEPLSNHCHLQNVTFGTTKYYGYQPGATQSKFTRKITLYQIVPDIESEVQVRVTWDGGGTSHSFETVNNIYSWF